MKKIIETAHRETPWTTWKYAGPVPEKKGAEKQAPRKKRKKTKTDTQ